MVLLKIAVKHNKLIKVRDTLMIEDTINGIKCYFEFRSDWSNLKPTVVFARGHIYPRDNNPQTISASLDANNECVVPPEIISESGEFSIGLFGENDETRIVTDWLYYKTTWGCYDAGIAPNPPTPDMYDRILGALNNKSDVDHTHNEIYYSKSDVDEKLKEYVTNKELDEYDAIFKEADPTVPLWAKQKNKPMYTAEEVGADIKGSANTAEENARVYTDEAIKSALNIRDNNLSLLDAGLIIERS